MTEADTSLREFPSPGTREDLCAWLREADLMHLKLLWRAADECRRHHVGDDVHLRGLIEISNHCARLCGYCGIRASNTELQRYRMSREEIIACAQLAVRLGYGTVVLQAGEDDGISETWMTELIRTIKQETPLAVTLSLGERTPEELDAWHQAGADRYLLRIETSNQALFAGVHPPRPAKNRSELSRIELLRELRKMGYEIGTGSLIGIPGQSYDDLAADLELFRELAPDMIGVGPFIPHPKTPLGSLPEAMTSEWQAPNSELMTYKMVALARLLCPHANIPSTTALATLNLTAGRELGLRRGANIIMPNLTPPQYRPLYEIYPEKACLSETAEQCYGCVEKRIESIGRRVGSGPGTSPSMLRRRQEAEIDRSESPRL